jgi:hypothetical protein
LKSFVHVFDIAAKGFVNSLQILAVPPPNVQPDKWISDRLRRERVDESRARKKERRRIKRHGDTVEKDGAVVEKDPDAEEASGIERDGEVEPEEDEDNSSASDEDMEETTVLTATLGKPRSGSAKAEPEILLFASLAREPRLGRWDAMRGRSVRNGTLVVHLGKQAL